MYWSLILLILEIKLRKEKFVYIYKVWGLLRDEKIDGFFNWKTWGLKKEKIDFLTVQHNLVLNFSQLLYCDLSKHLNSANSPQLSLFSKFITIQVVQKNQRTPRNTLKKSSSYILAICQVQWLSPIFWTFLIIIQRIQQKSSWFFLPRVALKSQNPNIHTFPSETCQIIQYKQTWFILWKRDSHSHQQQKKNDHDKQTWRNVTKYDMLNISY